jgi:hypothetical protein
MSMNIEQIYRIGYSAGLHGHKCYPLGKHIVNDAIEELEALREELAAAKAEKVELIWGLKNAKLFANWVECLGRTDCEIYKHELKASADQSIERIDKFLDDEAGL